jgi:tryptophan 2,3-dioxygenase
MAEASDANWWDFSVDPDVRRENVKSRFVGPMDVNPEMPGGVRQLDYHAYLGLDRLLACQRPSSRIPDERAFIVTHQLMEIIFKLIVFDLAVTARTLRDFAASAARSDDVLARMGDDEFWRPALTASARTSFACRDVLPTIMRYLSDPKDADETFNSVEFHRYRDNLEPASGFQSAQFRLIQRALGKSNLLAVRMFPARTYQRMYGDGGGDTVKVVDPIILREDAAVATPAAGDPLDEVARLDDAAHGALERLATLSEEDVAAPDGIAAADVDRAVVLLERIMSARRNDARVVAPSPASAFSADLEAAAARENARRRELRKARAGAVALRKRAASSPLNQILSRLVAADEALHGTGQDSFLSVHLRVTRERLRHIRAHTIKMGEPEPSIGTGGGGVEYLGWSQRYLIPLFPALVAYREIGD